MREKKSTVCASNRTYKYKKPTTAGGPNTATSTCYRPKACLVTTPLPKGVEKAADVLVDANVLAGSGLSAGDWTKSSVLGLMMCDERALV